MAKDIQGRALGWASRFSGNKTVNNLKLRKPAEKVAYMSTKMGFQVVGSVLKRKAAKPRSKTSQSGLFDLTLTDEQQMIKDSIRAYTQDVLRPLALDADEQQQLPNDYLSDLMALGLNYFSVPERLGGATEFPSPVTSAIIAEELAWGDMSLAYAALAPVAVANAIVRWGTDDQQQAYLPQYLEESPIKATIALQEPQPLFNPNQLSCTAEPNKKGYRLNGVKSMVPFGGSASLYLVAADLDDQPALFLVPADTKGVSFKASPSMGLRAAELGELTLDQVQLNRKDRLGNRGLDYQNFLDLGQLHWCALAVGTCQAALDYVIPYVNEREAFGEPISHRQSVAFMVANIGIELESMRLLLWRAASLAEQGKDFHREAYLAHLLCSEKAMEIGTNAVQLLGGHGFTKEHPAERWYRDLRVLACVNSGLHL